MGGQHELKSLLDSERELRNEKIDSESKSHACELEMLSNEVSRKHSEALKMCRTTYERSSQIEESVGRLHAKTAMTAELASNCNERCTPLEESMRRLDARTAELASCCNERCTPLEESVGRLDAMTAELASNCSHETIHEQFESLLTSERTALREFVSTERASLAESLTKMVTEALSCESSNRQKNIDEMKDCLMADHTEMKDCLVAGHSELNNLISQHHNVHTQACQKLESDSKSWGEECYAKIKMNESLIADACGNLERLDLVMKEKFSTVEERIGAGASHMNVVRDEINKEFLKLWQKIGV